MKGSNIAIIVAGVALIVLLSSAAGSTANSNIDLSQFISTNGADDVQRLQNVLNVLNQQSLSPLQVQLMLAQILQETGLFTDAANYHAVDDLNNYAGISSGGNLKAYGSIQDFVTDYIRVLSQSPNYPINATSVTDFNNRLKANGYYTDSSTTYGNNLTYYFNLLS